MSGYWMHDYIKGKNQVFGFFFLTSEPADTCRRPLPLLAFEASPNCNFLAHCCAPYRLEGVWCGHGLTYCCCRSLPSCHDYDLVPCLLYSSYNAGQFVQSVPKKMQLSYIPRSFCVWNNQRVHSSEKRVL